VKSRAREKQEYSLKKYTMKEGVNLFKKSSLPLAPTLASYSLRSHLAQATSLACPLSPPYPEGGPLARWEVVCCSQQVTSVACAPLQGRGVNNALGLLN
jgi:hypothetical protein